MNAPRSAFCLSLSVLALAGMLLSSAAECHADPGSKANRRPIVMNPRFDASAEKVDFFDAQDDGRVESKLVANDSKGGFVFISNTTDQTLNVTLPQSFVAVQVLKQLGMGGGGMGGMGGGGMFSIPPERTLKVPFVSACLNHGKAEPNPRVEYKIVRVSDYTDDAVLAELIRMVGTGRVDQQSAQAAIWTRTDNLTWEQLASKSVRGIHGYRNFFQPGHIAQGQLLMTSAEARVRQQGEEQTENPEATGRVR